MNLSIYLQGLREKEMNDEPPSVTWVDIPEIVRNVRELNIKYDELVSRINILLLENARLKVILEDISHEVSKELTHKPTTRRKS